MKAKNKKTDPFEVDFKNKKDAIFSDYDAKVKELDTQFRWFFSIMILILLIIFLATPIKRIHSEIKRKFPVTHEVKVQ